MRIAVIGGTGQAGRHAVGAVERAGHEAVVVARSRGVDVVSGAGLDDALAGADAVIDAGNLLAHTPEEARDLFGAATRNLLDAGSRAGVGHHVLLSIAGLDRIAGNAHYAGKRLQEELVSTGPLPFTILRATQFHEFAAMLVSWTRDGDVARLPPLLLQPVAAADVGEALAEIAAGAPLGRTVEIAGPGPEDLVDMARRTLAARGDEVRLVPTWRSGAFGVEAAGEAMLPSPDARVGPTTFEAWLGGQGATGRV